MDATANPLPGGSTLRLRPLTNVTELVLALLALLACTALVLFTIVSRSKVEHVEESTHNMRAADSLRAHLLAYSRFSDLAYVDPSAEHDRSRLKAEASLFRDLDGVRRSVHAGREERLVGDGEEHVHDYLVARKAAEREGRPLQEVLVDSAAALDAALSSADALAHRAELNLETVHRSWSRWATVGMTVGIIVACLVLLGLALVLLLMRRLVFQPLTALIESVDRYAAGDHKVRIVPSGPDEFRRTAITLNHIADQLDREEHDRLTFLGGVAHDLRNPLAALQMAVRYLAPDHPLPAPEKIRRTLDLVGRQVTLLNRMVGDFLDATRIRGGHLELRMERRDVRELLSSVAELYRTMSFSHRVMLSLPDEPVFVRCDGERIEQVLNNLVSNAIKYSPAGGNVEISVTERDGEAVIAVSDHGIGIGPTDVERIFAPFRRTGASREIAAGVGLGLSVARAITVAHGGAIDVESQVGVGSTFRVRLPLARATSVERPAPAPLH